MMVLTALEVSLSLPDLFPSSPLFNSSKRLSLAKVTAVFGTQWLGEWRGMQESILEGEA
jgi:hypothetical protein